MAQYTRLLALSVTLFCGSAVAAPTDELRELLGRGQAEQAYELGRQHPDSLGDPEFDLLYGVAAIDSGHAGEGVLALERYVLNRPNDLRGRVELARGYYVVGDDARAREEFQGVLDASPPAELRASIERFMDALRARESRYRPSHSLYLEGALGLDTNVNAGLSSDTVPILLLGVPATATVNPAARQARDWFGSLALGGGLSRPLRPGLLAFGTGRLEGTWYETEGDFDQRELAVTAGLTRFDRRDTYRGTVGFDTLYVDRDRFRSVYSISGEWYRQLDELSLVGPFAQWSSLSYGGTNSLRDSDFYTLGGAYRRAFIVPWQPVLGFTGYFSRELMDEDPRDDLSRKVYGLRGALTLTPAPDWTLGIGAVYQDSRYDGSDPPPLGPFEDRHDRYWGLDLGVGYRFSRQLRVEAGWEHTVNGSNIPLYEYDRDLLETRVRYDFE